MSKGSKWKIDSKKKIFFIELFVIVIAFSILFGMYYYNNYIRSIKVDFDNQTIDNVTFKDAKLVYKSKKTMISVKMKSEIDEPVEIKKLTITLYDKDELQVSRIEVDFSQTADDKVRYLKLEKDQEYEVQGEALDNLTEAIRIEYEYE